MQFTFTDAAYNQPKVRYVEGGLVVNTHQIVVPSAAVAGDTILVDSGPFDTLYVEASLETEGTAGLVADLGIVSTDDETDNFPGFFGADIDLITPGDAPFLLNHPKWPVDADGRKFGHKVYITLKGAVAAGDTFWFVTKAKYYGAPESL